VLSSTSGKPSPTFRTVSKLSTALGVTRRTLSAIIAESENRLKMNIDHSDFRAAIEARLTQVRHLTMLTGFRLMTTSLF
jgi:hypothetical protein